MSGSRRAANLKANGRVRRSNGFPPFHVASLLHIERLVSAKIFVLRRHLRSSDVCYESLRM